MSEREIGYVVIEFNQASGEPSTDGDFFDSHEEASEVMGVYQRRDNATGRKERYAIGTVTIEEEDQ